MPPSILMDEFHVSLFVPARLAPPAQAAICRTLNGPRFHAALRRAVQAVLRRYPSLRPVRVTLSR